MAATGFKSRPGSSQDHDSSNSHSLFKPGDTAQPSVPAGAHSTAQQSGQTPAHQTNRSAKPLDDNLKAMEDDFYGGRSQDEPTQNQPEPEPTESAAQPSGSMNQGHPTPDRTKTKTPSGEPAPAQTKTAAGSPKPGTGAPGSLAPKPGAPDPYNFGGEPSSSLGQRFAGIMRKHPKGMAFGIIALVSVIISIIVFIISIPFQLIHMAKSLLDFNFGAGDRIERIATHRVIARLMRERAATRPPAEGARRNTGRPISDKLFNMRIDRFEKVLARENLKLQFDGEGRLTGIANTLTGEVLRDFSDASFKERRTAIGTLVHERIAPWRVLKRVHYTKVMKYHARVSFKFWPKEKIRDIKKLMAEKARIGASAEEMRARGTQPADPDKPANPGGADAAENADEGVKAATEEFNATGDKQSAIAKGVEAFKSSGATRFFGITGIIALVCYIKEMADEAAANGYIERTEQLMKVGNMIPTMTAQMYTGQDLDIEKFGATMAVFTGNPNSSDPANRRGWDQSAAAKRHAGEPVVSNPTLDNGTPSNLEDDKPNPNYNPDLSEAANPDGFALHGVVEVIDTIFSYIPGSDFVCKVATGIFGFLIQAVELVGAIFTGGATAIAAIAAQTAVQVVVFGVVLPQILAAAADLAITGTENAVDFFNNADAGMRLSAEDYHRAYGGRQMSNEEETTLVNAVRDEQIQIAREKGWFYRTLDLTNMQSVASSVLIKVPNTPAKVMTAITNLPRTFSANLGSIVFGNIRPAFAAPIEINPYDFQFYGFTEGELEKYPDFIDNENYLATDVIPGKSRLSVLGDPTNYNPEDGDLPLEGNLLHCFVNKFRAPTDPTLEDDICAGIGVVTTGNTDGEPNAGNPTDAVQTLYDEAGLGIPAGDDFLRYRIHLLYTHITRGMECESNEDDCFTKGSATTAQTPAPTGPVAGDPRALATQLANHPNMIYSNPDTKASLLAYGRGETVTNACGAPMGVSPYLSGALLSLATRWKITVVDIGFGTDRSYCEGGTYQHPKGNAIDLEGLEEIGVGKASDGLNNFDANTIAITSKFATEFLALLPPTARGGIGQKNCGVNPTFPAWATAVNGAALFDDGCNHLHIDVRNREDMNEAAGTP